MLQLYTQTHVDDDNDVKEFFLPLYIKKYITPAQE